MLHIKFYVIKYSRNYGTVFLCVILLCTVVCSNGFLLGVGFGVAIFVISFNCQHNFGAISSTTVWLLESFYPCHCPLRSSALLPRFSLSIMNDIAESKCPAVHRLETCHTFEWPISEFNPFSETLNNQNPNLACSNIHFLEVFSNKTRNRVLFFASDGKNVIFQAFFRPIKQKPKIALNNVW